MNPHKCLICEKEIPLWDPSEPNHGIHGGTISVFFGFGCNYDWVGLRMPKYAPTDPILDGKPGYTKHPKGTEIFPGKPIKNDIWIADCSSNIETVPVPDIDPERKDAILASSKNIKAHICDKCFAKKLEFFEGSED